MIGTRAYCLLLAALSMSVSSARLASTGEVETAGGQSIVGTGDTSAAYYAPSGVISLNGSSFFLYVQGDDNIYAPPGDQVFMFTHPATWSGLTTTFDLSTRVQILPGSSQPSTYYYGGPAVFTDAGTYYMTASKSANAADFNEILIGCSTNGSNWTWRTLFTTAVGNNIAGATQRYSSIGGSDYWWGFVELAPCQVSGEHCLTPYSGLGAFRVHLTSHAPSNCANPTWDRIDFLSNGRWQSVLPGQQLSFVPDYISFTDIEPKLHWITDHWELWTTAVSEPNYHCHCDNGLPSNYAADFHYQTVATGATSLAPNPPSLYSQIRCLPASYATSAFNPFRIEGTSLLYSATADKTCGRYQGGAYIIVTGLTP